MGTQTIYFCVFVCANYFFRLRHSANSFFLPFSDLRWLFMDDCRSFLIRVSLQLTKQCIFTADKRYSQIMNRYSTPIGEFVTKKLLTHHLLFLWIVFWITQEYTDQQEFGAEDLKFCNSKECCCCQLLLLQFYYILSLFSGDRQVGELSVVSYCGGSSLKILIIWHKLLTITQEQLLFSVSFKMDPGTAEHFFN